MSIFDDELVYAAFLKRDVERRRQELDELWSAYPNRRQGLEPFTITSMGTVAPSPAPMTSINSPASSATPPSPTSSSPTSASTIVVQGAEEDTFTTAPTKCSTDCGNQDKNALPPRTAVLRTEEEFHKEPPTFVQAHVELHQRYISNYTYADSSDAVLPCLATRVGDVERVFEKKSEQYSVVLWPPFTSAVDWMLSKPSWPPPIQNRWEGIFLLSPVLLQPLLVTIVDRGHEPNIMNVEIADILPKPPWLVITLRASNVMNNIDLQLCFSSCMWFNCDGVTWRHMSIPWPYFSFVHHQYQLKSLHGVANAGPFSMIHLLSGSHDALGRGSLNWLFGLFEKAIRSRVYIKECRQSVLFVRCDSCKYNGCKCAYTTIADKCLTSKCESVAKYILQFAVKYCCRQWDISWPVPGEVSLLRILIHSRREGTLTCVFSVHVTVIQILLSDDGILSRCKFSWVFHIDIMQQIMMSEFRRECCSPGICVFCHWKNHLLPDTARTFTDCGRTKTDISPLVWKQSRILQLYALPVDHQLLHCVCFFAPTEHQLVFQFSVWHQMAFCKVPGSPHVWICLVGNGHVLLQCHPCEVQVVLQWLDSAYFTGHTMIVCRVNDLMVEPLIGDISRECWQPGLELYGNAVQMDGIKWKDIRLSQCYGMQWEIPWLISTGLNWKDVELNMLTVTSSVVGEPSQLCNMLQAPPIINKFVAQLKRGGTTKPQSHIFPYRIQIRLLLDVEKIIHIRVELLFLSEWYSVVVFQSKHHVIVVPLQCSTIWEYMSNIRVGIAQFSKYHNELAADEISGQKKMLQHWQTLVQWRQQFNDALATDSIKEIIVYLVRKSLVPCYQFAREHDLLLHIPESARFSGGDYLQVFGKNSSITTLLVLTLSSKQWYCYLFWKPLWPPPISYCSEKMVLQKLLFDLLHSNFQQTRHAEKTSVIEWKITQHSWILMHTREHVMMGGQAPLKFVVPPEASRHVADKGRKMGLHHKYIKEINSTVQTLWVLQFYSQAIEDP